MLKICSRFIFQSEHFNFPISKCAWQPRKIKKQNSFLPSQNSNICTELLPRGCRREKVEKWPEENLSFLTAASKCAHTCLGFGMFWFSLSKRLCTAQQLLSTYCQSCPKGFCLLFTKYAQQPLIVCFIIMTALQAEAGN